MGQIIFEGGFLISYLFEFTRYFFDFHTIVQCNLDLVILLVSAKSVTKLHNVTKSNDFM